MARLSRKLSAELSELSKQQSAALEKATFLGMTTEERVEYDNRHDRIVEILQGDGLGSVVDVLRAA